MALRLFFITILGLAVAGCDSDTYYDWMYKGTALGFAHCVKSRTSGGMSSSLARIYCIKRHEGPVPPFINVSGSALYSQNPITFWGSITNKSDFILTAFAITVKHSDQKGDADSKRFDGQYVEPQNSVTFSIDSNELKFKPNLPERAREFEWTIVPLSGIKLQ